jgi:hypothetical protein
MFWINVSTFSAGKAICIYRLLALICLHVITLVCSTILWQLNELNLSSSYACSPECKRFSCSSWLLVEKARL